ncbi:MAG: hypothetical protein WA949_20700 [Phormidesmis sp.]
MAPRKLSDSDKSDIVDLYKQPEQTTSTLAEQFGVSNSTISRILKTTLPAEEYGELIAQKRMSSGSSATAIKTEASSKRRSTKETGSKAGQKAESKKVAATTDELLADPSEGKLTDASVEPPKLKKTAAKADKDTAAATPRRRSRKKDDDGQLPLLDQDPDTDQDSDAEEADQAVSVSTSKAVPAPPVLAAKSESVVDDDDEDDDDLEGLDDTLGDDFGDDEDDLDEDEDDLDEDEDDGFELPRQKLHAEESVEIMPLDTAVMPKPCYLVVDMRAELITCPLSDFGHLGRIPSDEEKSTTLPVFDNHRVARRFSRNKQRVIKVPDGSLITRTSPYLQAKGITRLLVDGQVFDLVSAD